MKKHSFKLFMKRVAGVAVASLLVSIRTYATGVPADTTLNETKAVVSFMGTDNNSYVFNVVYNNKTGEKFSVRITDEAGNILFIQTYTDKKFDKRFRLLKQDVESKLNFTIRSLKVHSSEEFVVTATEQVVEQVVVQRM